MYAAYCDQGWPGLTAPEEFGGQAQDAYSGHDVGNFFGRQSQHANGDRVGAWAIRTLLNFGTDAQKEPLLPSLASGETIATMCLTEPLQDRIYRGSPVGPFQTGHNGKFQGKRFSSRAGIRISVMKSCIWFCTDLGQWGQGAVLFLCPSTKTDGTRNAVKVTRIEEKMGLHASPTCQMLFDGAEAELIGEEGRGLAAMFTMMNHARGDVALQGWRMPRAPIKSPRPMRRIAFRAACLMDHLRGWISTRMCAAFWMQWTAMPFSGGQ